MPGPHVPPWSSMYRWPPRLTWTLEGAIAAFMGNRGGDVGFDEVDELAQLLRALGFVAEGK